MSRPLFLIPPRALGAKELTRGTSIGAIEALACSGSLEPAQWLEPQSVYRFNQPDAVVTPLHDLPSSPRQESFPMVSEMDWARAKWGVGWPAGPSPDERLALWALSEHPPAPEVVSSLIELSLRRRWRFVLKALTEPHLMPTAARLNKLFVTALEQNWATGVAALSRPFLSQANDEQVKEWLLKWRSKVSSPAHAQGILAALPAGFPPWKAWGVWMDIWGKKELTPETKELTKTAAQALADATDPEDMKRWVQASGWVLANSTAAEVRQAALAYAAGFSSPTARHSPDFARALACRSPSVLGWKDALLLARRAVICSQVASTSNIEMVGGLRHQQAALFWLAKMATCYAQEAKVKYTWEKARLSMEAFKRKERLKEMEQRLAFTQEELMAGLLHFERTPWWGAMRNQAMEWVAANAANEEWMSRASRRATNRSSFIARLIDDIDSSNAPAAFVKVVEAVVPWVTHHSHGDPDILKRSLEALSKTGPSDYLAQEKQEAWDGAPLRHRDPILAVVDLVSRAATAGRLDVSGLDWQKLGGLAPLEQRLRKYALVQSLPGSAPARPAPRM